MIIKIADLSNLNSIATRNICVWIKSKISELKSADSTLNQFKLDFSDINFISLPATQGLLACIDELQNLENISISMFGLAPHLEESFERVKSLRYEERQSRPDLAPISVSSAEMGEMVDL